MSNPKNRSLLFVIETTAPGIVVGEGERDYC